jgi:hypothetical protein
MAKSSRSKNDAHADQRRGQSQMNRRIKVTCAIAIALILILSLAIASSALAETKHKSKSDKLVYQTIPISMMMEAGYSYAQDWWALDPNDPDDAILHSGEGWLTPFGRGEYVAVRNWDAAAQYRPAFMTYQSWKDLFGSMGLFCVYRLPDGDIYAFDGVMGNIEPLANDDGKSDYVLNVIVGGTGRYANATGMLLGRTPGRGAAQGPNPQILMKLMEGYINIQVKESKYSTALPSIGFKNPQLWPEAWSALGANYLVPMNMEMEAGVQFYEPSPDFDGLTLHSGIGWLEPFGRSRYWAGFYPYADQYRPDFMDDPSWTAMFGGTDLFCIYRTSEGDIYAWDGIMGNIQPVVNDDGKIDYLLNVIVGGTGAFENAGGILLGITPGRGPVQPTAIPSPFKWPDSILKLMEGYVEIIPVG